MRIVVTGYIGQYPLGGVTWDYFQYVLGLDRLGHEVYYIEDTGQWPYNPQEGGISTSCDFNLGYLSKVFGRFGLGRQWAYYFPWQDQWFGLSYAERKAVLSSADLLINISGSLGRPQDYRMIPRMVYIDSDPVFTQLKIARGQEDLQRAIALHDVHFSFGEKLGDRLPPTEFNWLPTRQPIVLSEWKELDSTREATFTTVMNWTSYKPIVYQGRTYGQKDMEFEKFLNLPKEVAPIEIELAINEGKTRKTPHELLRRHGWKTVNPDRVCFDLDSYREYLSTSAGEWSVAKNGYVEGSPGWFSCRSACYLAAGRPVVVQDTGFAEVIPTGRGIVTFSVLQEAVEGLYETMGNYSLHSKAAKNIAAEFFDSEKILSNLISRAFEEPIDTNQLGEKRPATGKKT